MTNVFRSTKRRSSAHVFGYLAAVLITLGAAGTARADNYAYLLAQSGVFGQVDMNSGAFTQLGTVGFGNVAGLGVSNGFLYTAQTGQKQLYRVNSKTGATTPVGAPGTIAYAILGSTPTGLYALDASANLYSINPGTGAFTLEGPTEVAPAIDTYNNAGPLSVNSSMLYWYFPAFELFYFICPCDGATGVSLIPLPQIWSILTVGGNIWVAMVPYSGSSAIYFATFPGLVASSTEYTVHGQLSNTSIVPWGLAPAELPHTAPGSLTFPAQKVGTTSAPMTVTLTNEGFEPMPISIGTTGNFASPSNNCLSPLLPSASCTISVTFTPTTTGALKGTLTITDGTDGVSQTVKLSGTGTT